MNHDLIVLITGALTTYGAIRFDLKYVRLTITQLERRFNAHMKKHHGGDDNG